MRARQRRAPSRFRQSLIFWLTIGVLALAVGVASFHVGRDWLGRRMGSLNIRAGAPRIIAQSDPSAQDAKKGPAGPPPDKAVINMEEREPTAAEVRELRDKGAAPEDQEQGEGDKADAEAPEGKDTPESTSDPSDPGAADESERNISARSSGGKYVVTAGSYRDLSNANRALARLAAKGYKPFIETVTVDGEEVQRVNVAVFNGRASAEDLRDELAREGLQAYITTGR